jgi:Ser/Thr protein kinase RdoA (MazF antagonist)
MMKLRYLSEDAALARRAVGLWPCDPASLDELPGNFRISSNAVYPYHEGGRPRIMRVAPVSEKQPGGLDAELAFIGYLLQNDFPAARPLASLSGNLYERFSYAGEDYQCTAFERMQGEQVDKTDMGREVAYACGRALGRMHSLSAGYSGAALPWALEDALNWARETCALHNGARSAREEAGLLEREFAKWPRDNSCHGVIHFDFEPDNLFFEPICGECGVIDFDDCMTGFYAVDVAVSLRAFREEGGSGESEEAFLTGYECEFPLDRERIASPVSARFADFFGFARILRAIDETLPGEPAWMDSLRLRLKALAARRQQRFGMPL